MKFFNSILITTLALVSANLVADTNVTVDGGLGWRYDKLKHTTFDNNHSVMINTRAQVSLDDGIYGRIDADYAWMIKDSKKAHATFINLNSINEVANSTDEVVNSTDDLSNSITEISTESVVARAKRTGYAYDITAAAGYEFCFCDGQLGVAPLIGYTYQRLQQKSHFHAKTLLVDGEPAHSSRTIKCEWYSLLVGVDVHYAIDCWDLFAELQYYPNFFQHHSFKNGYSCDLGAKYQIDNNWDAGVRLQYRNVYSSNWQTLAAVAEVGYSF